MPAPDFLSKLPAQAIYPHFGIRYDRKPEDWFQYLSWKDDAERGADNGNPIREFHYISLPTESFIRICLRFMTPRVKSFIDVGCGGGDKLAIVKENWPEVTVHGVEHDPAMAVWASLYADRVFCADAFTIDYSVYDLIYAYWPIANTDKMLELVDLIMTTKKRSTKFVLAGFHGFYNSKYAADQDYVVRVVKAD